MADLFDNVESPLFFNVLGSNPSYIDAMRELMRLKAQQVELRQDITTIRAQKEQLGAELIKQGGNNASLEYQLNVLVTEYYRLQDQDKELTIEISRVEKIYNTLLAEHEVATEDVTVTGDITATGDQVVQEFTNAEINNTQKTTGLSFEKTGLNLMGKTYTWGQVAAFAISILAVSFALAFPLKQPKPEEAKFQ